MRPETGFLPAADAGAFLGGILRRLFSRMVLPSGWKGEKRQLRWKEDINTKESELNKILLSQSSFPKSGCAKPFLKVEPRLHMSLVHLMQGIGRVRVIAYVSHSILVNEVVCLYNTSNHAVSIEL